MILAVAAGELIGWAALLGGMVFSFLYSGLETGLYSVNKIRLELSAEAGARAARRLRRALNAPGGPLGTLLIGNNLANDVASAGMVLVLTAWAVPRPDYVSLAVLAPVVFLFCELLPKNLFHRHADRLTYLFSSFLGLSRRAFTALGLVGAVRGLVWLLLRVAGRRIGPHDSPLGSGGGRIATLLAEGRATGALTHTQSVIAERVIRLADVRLADVMVPLERAVLVEPTVSAEEVRGLLAAHGHPRLGVYEGARENVVGVLSAYDVLLDDSGAPPSAHVTSAVTVRAGAGVSEALVALQRQRNVIGFVTDDDGRCIGLVTIKDLVEEIVGELEEG